MWMNENKYLALKLDIPIFPGHEMIFSWTIIPS